MAPGQGHHHSTLWRDTHAFYLLSPLRGFLSRAWSRLRGPGPPEPWRVEAVIGADQVEAGLELDTKDALATPYILCGRHPQRDVEDSGVPEDKGEADQVPCLGLKANSSPETWGLSDGDDEEYCEEEGNSVPREQGREFKDGQPAHLSPVLLIRSLQNSDRNTGEEAAEEEGVGHHEGVTEFSYPSPHWEGCPAVEEAEDGETVKKEVPGASPSPISPGFKPSSWVSCPGEKEDQTTEEKGTENKGAREASISPASSGSNPKIWECCLGEASKEKGDTAGEGGDPEPGALVPAQRSLCRAFDCEPSKKNTEKEEEVSALGVAEKEGGAESPSIPLTCASVRAWVFQTGEDTEDEDSDSGSAEKEGEADSSSSTPTTSAFLKAWVYRPGEDTEDEDDEDSDLGSAEEEGETEAPSSIPPTSAFLKAWVYRPGEDKEDEDDEDSDLGSDEEEGETEDPSSTPPTSAFLKAWVYQPGEDTEEEDECEKHEDRLDDSEAGEGGEAADSDSYPSLLDQSIPLRGWICRLGKEAEEEAAIKKRKEAEPCPLQVAIYLPGEKPPPPWAAPKLPLRLQRRLKLSEAPAQVSDPETPLKARKVRFSEKVTVHLLAVWAGPAQAARRGPWEQLARDRSRFARRIARAQEELGPCLTPASRATAWARLGNPLSFLSPVPAPTQLLPPPCDPSETPPRPRP